MAPEVTRLGSGEARTPPRIKLVGIGGAGCNIVSDSGMEAVAVLKAEEGVHGVKASKKCVLTADHVKLFKTTSPQMFHAIGGDLRTGVFGCIGDADIMFLFTGLGGETGSSVTPALANISRKHCKLVVVSAALPFSVEGGERKHVAAGAMEKVMEHSDLVITYTNDSLLKIAPNLPLRKAFGAMDIIMMAPVLELAYALAIEDLMLVRSDFGGCKHVRAGIGIAAGLERGLRAVEEAFTSPWFDFPVETARTALIIATASDMEDVQLQKMVKDVALRLPSTRIRYAGRVDPSMGEKMKLVVLLGVGPARP